MNGDILQTIAPAAAPNTATAPAAAPLTQDVLELAQIGKRVDDAIKAGKTPAESRALVLSELGMDIPELEQVAKDVITELPAIKSGWRTSEFWLIILLGIANGLMFWKTGQPINVETNATLGGLILAYTGSRTLVKNAPVTATATTSATSTTTQTASAPVALAIPAKTQ